MASEKQNPTYYVVAGAVSFGDEFEPDIINCYSIWEERPAYGFRPVGASYDTQMEAEQDIPHWQAAMRVRPQLSGNWSEVPCARGQWVVTGPHLGFASAMSDRSRIRKIA